MTEILSRNGEVKVLGLTISSIGQKTSNRNHHLGDPSVDGTTYNILRYDIIHIYIYTYMRYCTTGNFRFNSSFLTGYAL